MKYLVLLACAVVLTACSSAPQSPKPLNMANPASHYCVESGGSLRIENTATGQVGICRLPDGREVEEWELFRSSREAQQRVVDYRCARGDAVRVTYFVGQERALLQRGGQTIELRQQPSGSGFIYSNGPNTIRGKGDALTLEIGRMAPIECQATGA